ncbi:hypothetical protein O3M35_012362 [Rhynocoris fuscipes]|uniref:Uncharacterized protein n=1 Tax=Rhynocoris fuscipes TaxID=488301 RepID=A0AAW1CUM2_9HEMI
MMPLAPNPVMVHPTTTSKPKIGFSIDSIVGDKNTDVVGDVIDSGDESPRCSPKHPASGSSSPLDPGRSPPPVIRPNAVPSFPKNLYLHEPIVPNHHQLALVAAAQQQFNIAAAALSQQPNSGMPSHHYQSPRDSYPLNPWLISRHGRIFPHRFPGGESIFFFNCFINFPPNNFSLFFKVKISARQIF